GDEDGVAPHGRLSLIRLLQALCGDLVLSGSRSVEARSPGGTIRQMPLYKEQGIVLRSVKLGEADKIVTILTQGSGKVRGVAKGIRRTQSKFGARLEPFTHVSLLMYRGRHLDTITQAEILTPFIALRSDFD